MYSPKVVNERLIRAEKHLGFEPLDHSGAQVEQANRHFNSLRHPDTGSLIRPLDPDEIKWIRNERTMCACDFRYYLTRYCFIADLSGNLIRFERPWVSQLIMLDVLAEMEEEGCAIAIQQLKARQLGNSELWERVVAHRVQMYPNVKAVVVSSDPDKSEKMSAMMRLTWEHMPFFLMPEATRDKRGELIEFRYQNSAVSIQHGTQLSGIARGWSPLIAHLSELPDFDHPEELVDASLLKAMHETPWMLRVLESTAKGLNNWWHRTWEISKEGWPKRTAKHRPVFLPWFVGTDVWPTPTWLHDHPVPQDWIPMGVTQHHAERARNYVRSNDLLRKHLGTEWEMPRHQMWFWEVEREEHRKKKELNKFLEEMPADDLEAFQSTNISVFDVEVISEYNEMTRGAPLEVYGIEASPSLIPLRVQPDRRDIDENKPPLEVVSRWNPTQAARHYTLVPLRFQGYVMDPMNKLFVWEEYEPAEEYGLGVDTSDGIGKDRSCCELIRKGTLERNDGQVAEFTSPYMNSIDLAPVCDCMGTMYSDVNGDRRRQLRMAIETKFNGEATQLELRKMGWSNMHPWVRFDNKRVSASSARKLGIFTVSWFRTLMLDYLIKILRDGLIDIHSPWLVNEMKTLEGSEEDQKLRAAYGGFDDRLMATGFAWVSMHILEIRLNRLLSDRRQAALDAPLYPRYSPGAQGSDIAAESVLYAFE